MSTSTSNGRVEYTLAPYQDNFINSSERQVGIIGAKGSSKSWSGTRFILAQVAIQPSTQGIVMFNTLQQARDMYFQEFEPLLRELDWPFSFNAQTMVLKIFDNIIHFRSAEPDAVKKIESIAYCFGWADEASYYAPESLKTFVSRIRKGKAIVRITSMPDEPDAFIYRFLEDAGFKLYEISLADNPDREFADRYANFLKTIYTGAELQRYLSGDRVSLSGMGLFAVDKTMKTGVDINTDEDLVLSWDFNAEYRAVSAWQKIGINHEGYDVIGCVASWQLRNADIHADAIQMCEILEGHKARIFLHGDASGEARTATVTQSGWQTIRKVFVEKIGHEKVRSLVPKANPPVKDTILCLNWALRNKLIEFNANEKNVYASLSACKADRYGDIDKTGDYRGGEGARSHETDTARYAVWHFFNKVYPGRKRVYLA